ncbi:MAG: c-type cytochrome [Chloroflexi bacterium]|nr:c-type cytochrome [Chloroflexota bacterium]
MLKNENYNKQLLIGLIITVVLLASFSFIMAMENARLVEATEHHAKESLQHGRALFVENCASCHGSRGEGGVGPALNDKTLLEEASNGVLFATIQTGRPNTTMPAWGQSYGGALTDEDIHAVVDYIREYEENAPDNLAEDFVPSASRGASLFSSTCFTCHGEDGKGGEDSVAPAINNVSRLKQNDNEWYEQTIINGHPSEGMPIWGEVLSNNQIEDLLALFEAWRAGEEVIAATSVSQMLDSALFALEEGNKGDALFYLERAEPIAFGPLLSEIDSTTKLIDAGTSAEALSSLEELRNNWPMGDAETGEPLYQTTCSGCHGAEGQGSVGPKLQPSTFLQESTNAEVFAFTLVGREGTAMRGFEDVLSEEELANIISFLRTWQE